MKVETSGMTGAVVTLLLETDELGVARLATAGAVGMPPTDGTTNIRHSKATSRIDFEYLIVITGFR
jgi:hypothetical protein